MHMHKHILNVAVLSVGCLAAIPSLEHLKIIVDVLYSATGKLRSNKRCQQTHPTLLYQWTTGRLPAAHVGSGASGTDAVKA
jgi:hypothetical protein